MTQKNKTILITFPDLSAQGGVASFYDAVFPRFSQKDINVRFIEIGSTKGTAKYFHPLLDQLLFRKALCGRVSVVHVNPSLDPKSFLRDGIFILQAKRQKLKVLVFFHGWRKDFERIVTKRLLWLFKGTFGKADAFIVLASEFENVLRGWGVTQPIYLGSTNVDDSLLENFSLAQKIARIQKADKVRILFLSRLEKEKGVFETIDAVTRLINKGLTVSLSVAGDGAISDSLHNYVSSLNLPNDSIRFLGYVREKQKIEAFVEHDIYCFPTYNEGMPISLLEAMAFGMPVVTRPVGGIKDFFINGKMGFLSRSKSPEKIAELLQEVIQDKPKMIEIARYNYAYAQENFMASAVAEKLDKIYEQILSS